MMTGLVIRMAQYLGLQRDGSHFPHLTPYEIEIRRRVWWAISALDLRVSEDQGTELAISNGSFDTKIPLNINDEDIDPTTIGTPVEHDGITNVSMARIFYGMSDIMRQMTAATAKHGVSDLSNQDQLLAQIYQKFEDGYCRFTNESDDIKYWLGVTIARLTVAKMTLIIYLPVLFSPPSEQFSQNVRNKLLISAIELAEYNHALNAEEACRQWRWLYQTYTHWHAIVYLLIETSRRPWSAIVERAWAALHSSWLIPTASSVNKNLRIWVPLRKLMNRARQHREAELSRLRDDRQAALELDEEDQRMSLPSSPGPFPKGSNLEVFRDRWRQLVGIPTGLAGVQSEHPRRMVISNASYTQGVGTDRSIRVYPQREVPFYNNSDTSVEQAQFGSIGQAADLARLDQSNSKSYNDLWQDPSMMPGQSDSWDTSNPAHNPLSMLAASSLDTNTSEQGFVSWPWWSEPEPVNGISAKLSMDGSDSNMMLDDEVNWYNWVESAKIVG